MRLIFFQQFLATQLMMETTKQQSATKGLRRSTLRKSIVTTEKVVISCRATYGMLLVLLLLFNSNYCLGSLYF